jgi:selenocysteine-specific translation elongation factor
VNSINFVILGDFQVASELGKKGTTTDLSIFDGKLKDVIYTWTVPIKFPPKIQSLMQAINIAECHTECYKNRSRGTNHRIRSG